MVGLLTSGRRFFELDQLDAALARLAQLRPDLTRIPPNAASRAHDRSGSAWQSRDWAALRALASPDFRYEDRTKRALVSGDVETWIENQRFVQAASLERERIGAAGDRIALERVLWRGGPEEAPVEREHLRLTEVDGDGRIRASIRFDLDDRRAASVEMTERYLRQVAGSIPPAGVAAMRVFLDHDLARLRAVLPDDFVLDDQRRAGVGRIEGPDAFLESLAALFEQAPDLVVETLYGVAADARGVLEMAHLFGTLAASGGPFEGVYVRLWIFAGDRLAGIELFEPEELDRARERFEELGRRR